MASANVGRIFALNILLAIISVNAQGVPPVTLQAFKPKGFRAYIDDTQYLSLFVFQGNVNRPIGSSDVGTLSGEVLRATDGKWIFEDRNLQLKVGDVINYYVFVSIDRAGYLKDNLSYTITELKDLNTIAPAGSGTGTDTGTGTGTGTGTATVTPNQMCGKTLTQVNGGTACAGQTIFEDNFDTLRESFWQVEQYVPIRHNEIPFVTYQRLASNPTVKIVNGTLRIAPTIQQNVPGYNEESITSGEINLFSGCTSDAEACSKKAEGADILQPIVSGRITSKGFAFKYGTIYVRAKLPLGDWLYPEILLEPFQNKYGRTRYASGVLKIACARGNRELTISSQLYGNRVLYGGPIMDFTCRETLLNNNILPIGKRWGDEFHVYALRWEPESITLLVDGEEWARVTPASSGLVGWFPKECMHVQRALLGYGGKLAPFDEYFYIALGVAAGGITEFPDGSFTGSNRPKPWTNAGRKAMVTFWQDMHNWVSTWDRPELLIDYVRVVAL